MSVPASATPLSAAPSTVGAAASPSPDRDEARRLLEEELEDGRYHREGIGVTIRDFVESLMDRLGDGIHSTTGIQVSWGPVVLLLLIVAAVTVTLLIVRPRLQRGRAEAPLDAEPGISADQLRARAAAHLETGAVDEAYRDLFRALVRAAEERELLPELPGRTATEAAAELGGAFSEDQSRIRRAADLFNLSRYGGRHLRRDDVEDLRELDRALGAAEPTTGAAGWSAPQVVAPR
ncbi:DUF4129 domain-containing protein [Nesterenkonia marinintestina]|uniref:DUF4129 domain-containing protein n=1 Tax=Nesterenkonia marinintestina TaxID=2979865 RepID=UPI0021C011A2|nr:DUF4129 domain-containing protein [Nesterenkonia sp. GX14115]